MTDADLLLKVLSEVFEGFAFMFVEAEAGIDPDGPGECLHAEIEFASSQERGWLEVIAPVELCRELAVNILGTDDESIPEGAGESALEEVLNVSCGYLLAEKFGTDTVFDLSIPTTRPAPENNWPTLAENRDYSAFLVDDSPMLVRLRLAGQKSR